MVRIARQLQQILAPEPAQRQREQAEIDLGAKIVGGHRGARRRAQHVAAERTREPDQTRHGSCICSAIRGRDAADGSARRRVIAGDFDPPAVRQESGRAGRLQPFAQAQALQAQVAGDARMQGMEQMRHGRDPESRREFPRCRRAARPVVGFQHHDLQPRFGEIGGGNEAVVAGADDGGIVDSAHFTIPRRKSFRISRAALAPGAPMTPPPGWVPEPHM